MCIKESRYHPLCNGRLDAPVHDLVPGLEVIFLVHLQSFASKIFFR